MGDDAREPSQAAQITPRTAEMVKFLAELVHREVKAERERQAQIDGILSGAPLTPPPPPRKRRPNPHNLHVVRGFALAAAGAAGWLLHSRLRRAAAMALIAATATGATVAPGLLQPAPAAQMPDFDGHHHHHHVERHHRDGAVLPVVMPPRRRRRRASHSAVMPGGSPQPSPSPRATAAATPDPDPVPSVTVPPLPLPAPTCLRLTGHHCHDDGLTGSSGGGAAGVLGALAGSP